MSEIWYFYPANETVYRRILRDLTPILDREGLSFHIARPEEAPQSWDTAPAVNVTLSTEKEVNA